MRRSALLWCGQANPNGRFDFPASVRDLDMSVRAARALGVADENMHALVCRDDLLPPEFGPSRHPATVAGLKQATSMLAVDANPGDTLLFIATNHCDRRGLLTAAEVDEFADDDGPQLLTPQLLAQHLDPLPGAQVLIFAVCHAGIFLPLGERANRLVLAACREDEAYYVQEEPICSPFLLELFGAWCGIEPAGYEARFSSSIVALSTAFTQAEERLANHPDRLNRLKPIRQGTASWPP